MTKHQQRSALANRCRELRRKGFSLGEIVSATRLPKTTVQGYVKDILLTNKQREKIEARRKQRLRSIPSPRKGKCVFGRSILRPKTWSNDLVHILAHFMFDGTIREDGCLYYSKDKFQILHLRKLVERIFDIKPLCRIRDNGVKMLAFYNVELASYIKSRKRQIFHYIKNGAPKSQKRVFLQAFFDDEGNIYYKKDTRRVRGYQDAPLILQLIRKLLKEFDIRSSINRKGSEIEISGRGNLEKFAKEINFSRRIYMNPDRENSIWNKRIAKRKILELAIQSYRA